MATKTARAVAHSLAWKTRYIPPPRPYIKGFLIMSLDFSSFSPVADVLVVEKRNCTKCHFGSYIPTLSVMRLWTSHSGPHRHAIVPRKKDETPPTSEGS